MTKRPRLLDMFCCAGGAAMGYSQAGFDVVGVDLDAQPRYPFEFIQTNALELSEIFIQGFDVIHASPPCQSYSPLNAYNRKTYPDLISPVRDMLLSYRLPYVIENVIQAPLVNPIMLCGTMFGLRMYRHRGFESCVQLVAPVHTAHTTICSRNGYLPNQDQFMTISGGKHSIAWRKKAANEMGCPWVGTIREVCEAIPPAYTKFIGNQLLDNFQ